MTEELITMHACIGQSRQCYTECIIIQEQPYRYQGLGNAGTNHYFKCAENCGLLLDLDRLENTNNHNISEGSINLTFNDNYVSFADGPIWLATGFHLRC